MVSCDRAQVKRLKGGGSVDKKLNWEKKAGNRDRKRQIESEKLDFNTK